MATTSAPPPAAGDALHDHRRASVAISEANVPASVRTTTCFGLTVRALVSKKKLRFVHDGVDLDLSYITDHIIAMGYPSRGLEALYRNRLGEVKAFLERRHGGHFRIWNLVAEREYGSGHFPCQIERFTWADHTPPPLALMRPVCESMESWLSAAPGNVAVVHCKAGKGRTGTVIAAYLLHDGGCATADEALQLFGDRRTRNGRGVTIPSQARYVRYYALQLAARRAAAAAAVAAADDSAAHAIRPFSFKPLPPGDAASTSSQSASPSASPVTPPSQQQQSQQAARRRFGATAVVERIEPLQPAAVASTAASLAASLVAGASSLLHLSVPGSAPSEVPRPLSSGGSGGPTAQLLTLTLHRDWERYLGFTVIPGYSLSSSNSGSNVGSAGAPPGASAGDRLLADLQSSPASVHIHTLREYPRDMEGGDVSSEGSSSSGAALNSAVPVPLRGVLRPGDVLVSVNGVDVSPAGGLSFPEVVSLLRGALDPLTLQVARAGGAGDGDDDAPAAARGAGGGNDVPAPAAPATGASSDGATSTEQQPETEAPAARYLRRLSRGIGPWAEGANTGLVPAPVVAINEVELSHLPLAGSGFRPPAGGSDGAAIEPSPLCGAWCGGAGGSSSSGRPEDVLFVQIYGGAFCRQLLWDSRLGAGAGAGTAAAAASSAPALSSSAAGASASTSAAGAPAAPRGVSASAPAVLAQGSPADAASSSLLPSASTTSLVGSASTSDLHGAASRRPSAAPSPPAAAAAAAHPHARPSSASIRRLDSLHKSIESGGSQQTTPQLASSQRSSASGRQAAAPPPPPPPPPEAVWGPAYTGAAGVRASGDLRVLLRHPRRKKALAAAWLHTACLPLPYAAQVAVAGELGIMPPERARGEEPHVDAGPPRPDLHIKLPPRWADMGEETGSNATTPAQPGDAAGAAASPAGGSSGSGGKAHMPIAPKAPVPPIVVGDVGGGAMTASSAPLLGACYTAAPAPVPSAARVAGAPPTSSAGAALDPLMASGALTLSKAQLDTVIKDKGHKLFPAGMTLTLRWTALGLPLEYAEAVAAAVAVTE